MQVHIKIDAHSLPLKEDDKVAEAVSKLFFLLTEYKGYHKSFKKVKVVIEA